MPDRTLAASTLSIRTLGANDVSGSLAGSQCPHDYGLLTLLVQLDFEPRDWFKIPAGCFFPQPDVDSACVILVRRAQPLLPAEKRADFHAIVKRAFSQRRKMMLKLLKTDWPESLLMQEFEVVGLSPKARAETVSVSEFVALTRLLR